MYRTDLVKHIWISKSVCTKIEKQYELNPRYHNYVSEIVNVRDPLRYVFSHEQDLIHEDVFFYLYTFIVKFTI